MKIGYLTSEYPHPKVLQAAGIGTSIKNLALALANFGHQVHVFVFNQKKHEIFSDGGITVHLIEHKKYFALSYLLYRRFITNYVRSVVAKEGIDIIESPDWTGTTAFSKFEVPVVIRLHGSDAYFCRLENRPQKRKTFVLEKLAINRADALVSPTSFAAELTAEIFGIDKTNIRVIPNGIPVREFRNQSPEDFVRGRILYMGTIIRKKGVLELPGILAEVCKAFPEAHLIVLGNDTSDITTGRPSTWEILREMNPEIAGKITWPGRVSQEQLRKYLLDAHVCVFPTFAETQGMVTIEAMAMQKPVVSSKFGWVSELIVDGESGMLADPSDHNGFASKIITLMRDDELRGNISRNARSRAESLFDIDKIAVQNVEFYKEVIG